MGLTWVSKTLLVLLFVMFTFYYFCTFNKSGPNTKLYIFLNNQNFKFLHFNGINAYFPSRSISTFSSQYGNLASSCSHENSDFKGNKQLTFLEKLDLTFKVLSDSTLATSSLQVIFNSRHLPTTFPLTEIFHA